ncbi:TonB-dependent receptor [Aliarcobacter butzleri]|uniref:TonB-dependent siderophore receptor n=1 Tax=Aliarcobacter butzleri TaxID=28197 RepID=UPI00263C4AD0|nr:TonB-dependent receptor [Aliarcobacter butzleri]MDN5099723.1 TonB-dependent receptor [Aliarcobacter butzleri]
MSLLKKSLIAPSLAILLATNLYSANYTVDTTNATKAIEKISELSNIPFIVDTNILNGKNTNKIQNVQNLDEALKLMFEGTGLEAVVKNNTIVIKKIEGKGTVLEPISVNESYKNGSSENGYLSEDITGVGLWGKRSLQDTPYSMTVITKDLIENTQANDMAKIFKMNPLTQDGGDQLAGNYRAVIRGFSSNNAVVNGMPLADFYSFTTMEDLESVETISGATGFLYGGGRVGGAVNYVMKKPTLEDKRSIKIGNYGGEQYYTHIDLSGQIDEKKVFGYRVNALYQDGDSVADAGKEQKFVSLAFDYKPTDNFTMDLNYAHRDLKTTNIRPMFVIGTYRPKIDLDNSYFADWTAVEEKNDRLMTSLRWDINDIFTLRSSLLYEKSDRKIMGNQYIYTRADELYDVTNRVYPSQSQEIENYSGSMYLDSKFETFGINHLLTVGYSENYFKYSIPELTLGDEVYSGLTLEQISKLSSPKIAVPNSKLIPSWKTQYKNILIGDDIVFNDQWSALVGVNYTTVVNTSYSSGVKSSKYDKSELTPTLSLMYKPFEDLTTYVTYIESLEQGTIVETQYSNANEILSPLVSNQYEVGAKYSLLDDKLLLTSALFRIEKANQYSDLAKPTPKYVQDGEQIHQGLELTMTGKVTDNLTIFGGGTLMDIEVEKSNNPALEGKKPTNAATKMAKLYAEYNLPFISGLTVTGGAYYTGEKYGNTTNTDKIPSYTLYDAGFRYKTKLDKYPTTYLLNVANLTGKDYWASGNYLGDPRSVAFSMKMEF